MLQGVAEASPPRGSPLQPWAGHRDLIPGQMRELSLLLGNLQAASDMVSSPTIKASPAG